MHLTRHTDYALRVLLYTAAAPNQTATISIISDAFGISKNHLRKVVHRLSQLGYLTTIRGRNGGITLALSPEKINIGSVVQDIEPAIVVECFDKKNNTCVIAGFCDLKKLLFKAHQNFLSTLSRYYLSDLIKNPTLITFCLNSGNSNT